MRLFRPVLAAATALAIASCGATTPVWYEAEPGKTTWTLPLVDPLADGELVVPVVVDTQGPFLFLLDPDAARTTIDRGLAERLDLYPKQYVRLLNQRDKTVPRRVFEVTELRAGELRARGLDVIAVPAGSLEANGRAIHGIIGSDLLSRTIVIHVDRDAGVVRLALTGHSQRPANAQAVAAPLHRGTLRVAATVQGRRDVDLIVHLARRSSALRRNIIDDLGLPVQATEEAIIDDTGDRVYAYARAEVSPLAFNGFRVDRAAFVNYVDERERDDITYHGVLGQNVLSRYQVVVDRDKQQLWLAPRAADLAAGTAARLMRWGGAFAECADRGCASVSVDGVGTLVVRPTPAVPSRDFVVTLQAVDAEGRPIDAPLLSLRTRSGTPASVERIADRGCYARAASFRVVDASPAFAQASSLRAYQR